MLFSREGEVLYNLNNTWRINEVAQRISNEFFIQAWPKWMFQLLLVAFGLASNALIILNFVKQRKTSVTNFYILFLASIDAFGCCVVIPLQIAQSANYYSFYNGISCKLLEWVKNACLASSSLVLQATAIDRYQAVCRPFLWRRIGFLRTILLLTVCIILGLLFTLPMFFITGIQRYVVSESPVKAYGFSDDIYSGFLFNQSYIYVCEVLNIYQDSWQSQTVGLLSMLIFLVLVTVTMFSYTAIYMTMKRQLQSRGQRLWVTPATNSVQPVMDVSASNLRPSVSSLRNSTVPQSVVPDQTSHPTNNTDRLSNVRHTQYRATRALLVVTVVFIMSWIPFWIVALVGTFNPNFTNFNDTADQILRQFFVELYFLNNAVNGIVYYVYNRSFRQYCRDLFRIRRCRRGQSD